LLTMVPLNISLTPEARRPQPKLAKHAYYHRHLQLFHASPAVDPGYSDTGLFRGYVRPATEVPPRHSRKSGWCWYCNVNVT
jgi:hypothetical protein